MKLYYGTPLVGSLDWHLSLDRFFGRLVVSVHEKLRRFSFPELFSRSRKESSIDLDETDICNKSAPYTYYGPNIDSLYAKLRC